MEVLQKKTNAARGGVLVCDGGELDADSEFCGLLIAGVRVKVVRRAVIELVAEAKFTTNVEADGGDCHTCGKPADNLKRFALVLFVEK
jgi:hypothetical protein